jgi:phosphinothricin acetyltransferase
MVEMLVRDAQAIADEPTLDAIGCAQVYAPYVTDTAISFEQTPPTPAEMATRIREVQREYAWLVANQNGRTLGYAYAQPFAARAAYRWSCEVSVYLAPHARGHGLGRALYTRLLDRLTRLGYRNALAGITQPNDASTGLHRTMGFTQCALYRGVGYKLDTWHDVAWYQRALGPGASTAPSG